MARVLIWSCVLHRVRCRLAVDCITGACLVNIPMRRIGCVGVFDRIIYVVSRRQGEGKYNCHRLKCNAPPSSVEAMATWLARMAKTEFVFDVASPTASPRLNRRRFLPTSKGRGRTRPSDTSLPSSPLSGSPRDSPLPSRTGFADTVSPLSPQQTSPPSVPEQTSPTALALALRKLSASTPTSPTGYDGGAFAVFGSAVQPQHSVRDSDAASPSQQRAPSPRLFSKGLAVEFGFADVDVDRTMLADLDGDGEFGWFPESESLRVDALRREELVGSSNRWISETDISTLPDAYGGDGEDCTLCMRNTAIPGERWVCMKNCECSFHSTCLELWRHDGHNVCPCCNVPISLNLFFSRLLGKYTTAIPVTPENGAGLVEQGYSECVKSGFRCTAALKVNSRTLRFEGVTGANKSPPSHSYVVLCRL
jgi:hypothetical protein